MTNETEHNQKFKAPSRDITTNLVETKQEKSNRMYDEVASLKVEVCQLKGLLSRVNNQVEKKEQNPSQEFDNNGRNFRRRLCPTCLALSQQGIDVGACDHCYTCGSSDHYRAGCRGKN